MSHWLDNTLQHLQIGEALFVSAVDGLMHGLNAPANFLGQICTGAERWQAAIREIQAPVNLADILRTRTGF